MTPVVRGESPRIEQVPGIPFPDADVMLVAERLDADELARLREIEAFLDAEVRPVVGEYWDREEFPFEVLPRLAEMGLGALELGDTSRLFRGLVYAAVTRADVSLSALVGIHNELVVGLINELGSAEQRQRWLPGLSRFEQVGCFALTEPDHGSDIAGGLATTATRTDQGWELTGAKRWIGAGTFADVAVVFARDTDDRQVKGFLVETSLPGFRATKISRKMGLRIMQNADITLDHVRVPHDSLLPGATSFAATNVMLRNSRAWVGWQGAGVQLAILDVARDYALQRDQFGRQLVRFQLVQEKLARIASNAGASLALMAQLAWTQDAGRFAMHHAALAKSTTTRLARESASLGRELLGGNGIVTDFEMSKIFNDVEVLHTYEGTYDINSLILGRAITGVSAFV